MFKFNKKVLFFFFAIALLALGAEINSIFQKGFDNPVFDIAILLSLVISAITLYIKIYRGEKE